MKKLLLLFVMLLTGVGAWAQLPADFVELPILTRDELVKDYETKSFAIRCVQKWDENYNKFYNGSSSYRAPLPFTLDMVYVLEKVEGSDATDLFYLKKKYADNTVAYLQTTNAYTFGSKDAATTAKFKLVSTTISDEGERKFDKGNSIFENDEDDTNIGKLVRFVRSDNNSFLNMNSGYATGAGVWSAQQIVDLSEYHLLTINCIKEGTTETVNKILKTGETVDVPQYNGYNSDVKTITKDESDRQVVDVNYTIPAKTLTPGAYFIYYTDENGTKRYLQTLGANNVTTVTENPKAYTVSTGKGNICPNAGYKLEMNGLYISNTQPNSDQIQTATSHSDDAWISQVFVTNENYDKYAIRLTNAPGYSQWHGHYYISKPSADGAVRGVDPITTDKQDCYIWTVEQVPVDYILTDTYGNQYTGSISEWESYDVNGIWKKIQGTSQCAISDATLSNNTLTASISFPFATSSETTTNGTMIANFNATQRWHAVEGAVKVQTESATSENISSWLWAIHPSFENNTLTIKIQNLASNQWIKIDEGNTALPNHNGPGAATLIDNKDEATAFEVVTWLQMPCFKLVNKDFYLSINSTNDTNTFLCIYNGANKNHSGNKVHFPAASYDITIGDIKAATLYTPFAVTIPQGVKAKYITAEGNNDAVNSGKLKYSTIENTIPANTAVVILGEAGTYSFNAATEKSTEVTDNLLFGYANPTAVTEHEGTGAEGTVYALHAKRGAFGHFTGDTYRAGKAYLDVKSLGENAGRIQFFSLYDEDVETGIDNIQSNEENNNGVAYDLSGRRVKPVAKGIYIINGKKVIK